MADRKMIYLDDAIMALKAEMSKGDKGYTTTYISLNGIWKVLGALPSAQPEIIRCKDCAKREYCRTSTVWAVAPDDNWYCADAERRADE